MTLTWWPTSGDTAHGGSSGEDKWEIMQPTWIGSGIVQGVGNEFTVYGDSTGMHVKLQSGRAWLDGTMANEDAASGDIILTVATADPTNPRIDRVVIRRDFTNHTMAYVVITGTPAVAPVPPSINHTRQGVYDISLAQVRVNAAVVTIAAGNITDERFDATVCGWAAQGNLALMCLSTAHPTNYPVGGFILEKDTGSAKVNTGTYAAPVWTALQLGAVSPESLFSGVTQRVNANYAVTGNVMFVFCQTGVQVTLPAANTTNRPITVMAASGNSTVVAASGTISGGSIDPNSGTVLNGTINQGDALTFKSYSPDGTNWVWKAIY